MSLLTKETDLLQFINKKKQSNIDVTTKKIITNYCKVMNNSIIKSYEKICIAKYSIICMETINNLFWILFLYSKNLKLTMFLCDRAILLFNEYILMTNTNIVANSNKENIQLIDVKSFVYKKTIGPLVINTLNFAECPILIESCNIFKKLYAIFIIYFINHNEDNEIIVSDTLNKILDTIFNNYFEIILEEYNNDTYILLNLINTFIDIDFFNELTLEEKHVSLFILIKLYKINNKDNSLNITYIIKKYYTAIFKMSKEYCKTKSFKKEILNIEVNEFYKLLDVNL